MHHRNHIVAALGLPENETGQQPLTAAGPHATTHTVDFGVASAAAQAQKQFATQQARAALAGVILTRIEADNGRPMFCASKWSMTKSFDSIGTVAAWLDRLAGVPR